MNHAGLSSADWLRRSLAASGAGLLAALILAVAGLGPAEDAIRATGDWLVRLAPKPHPPLDFALVLIDSSSLSLDQLGEEEIAASPALGLMAAGFPWSRAVYATAIERLLDAGARLVILDVLLVGPREGDEALRETLARHPGKVVLMSNFVEDIGHDGGTMVRYQLPAEEVLPPGGAEIGFANFWRDPDGVVRSAPFHIRQPGAGRVFSSPATALGLLKGDEARNELPDSAHFLPCMAGMLPEVRVPIWQLFSPREWEHNLDSGGAFRDKVVAIGASAPQFHDEFRTPVGQVVGAGLHLGALGAAWERAFYRLPGKTEAALFCLLGALAAWALWAFVGHVAWKAAALLAVAALAVPASVVSLGMWGFLPPLAVFWAGLGCTAVSNLSFDLLAEAAEKRRARRILDRYVSPGLAREILDARADFLQSLGGTRRAVTVLFSDVRGFTTLAESGEPTEIFEQLNNYFGHMVGAILEAGGGVDKFLGDGILAVWGTLSRRPPGEEAAAAVACARTMTDALVRFNADRAAAGLAPWKVGIGIHSGEVLFGNVGSEARMEPTVIGDTVNLASRIEGLTKGLGLEVLFSVATASLAKAAESARPADRVRVVGRKAPVDLFTFWPDAFGDSDREAHCAAISDYMAGRFDRAAAAFEALAGKFPGDALAGVLAKRARTLAANPPEGIWEGVYVAASK